MTNGSHVTLRLAVESEWRVLLRLAECDSADPLSGTVLVAEVDGEVLAALSVEERRAVANPFRRTAELVALLRVRATQLREHADGGRLGSRPLRMKRRWGPSAAPSPRPGRAVA